MGWFVILLPRNKLSPASKMKIFQKSIATKRGDDLKNTMFETYLSVGLLFLLVGVALHFIAAQPVCDLELTSHAQEVTIPKIGLNASNADFTLRAQVYCLASTAALSALKVN